jgi:universal stress protein A
MIDYTHILAAVDLSGSAEQILIKARDVAERNNARISLLHVIEYMPTLDYDNLPMYSISAIDEKEMQEIAEESLKKLAHRFNLDNVEMKVQFGTPKQVISQFVKENHCDLVVLGSHGRHGIDMLLGSTANAVLHAMPCDVLTVKIRK